MAYTGPYDTGTSGETYATIADAIAQAVAEKADIEGILSPEIELYNAENFAAAVAIPTYATLGCTREYPLVIQSKDGEGTATITGNITCAGAYPCGFKLDDVTHTGNFTPNVSTRGTLFNGCTMNWGSGGNWPLTGDLIIDGCTIDCTNVVAGNLAGQDGTIRVRKSKIRVANNGAFLWFGSVSYPNFFFENCMVIGGTGTTSLLKVAATPNRVQNISIKHCSLYNIDYAVYNNLSVILSGQFIFRNNIMSEGISAWLNAGYALSAEYVTSSYNRYYNMTKLYDTAGTDYANVAAAQANGWEAGSTEGDPGFANTTWGNANFLKLSASLANAKHCGIHDDIFGTAREKWSDIDPGAHQYAAAEESEGGGVRIRGILTGGRM